MSQGEASQNAPESPGAVPPTPPKFEAPPPAPEHSNAVDAPEQRSFGNDPLSLLVKLFSSFGLSVVLLIFLGILTFAGTLAQTEMGIHGAQKRYFESLFLVEWVFGRVPVPLPGGYLVMTLLTINLFVGGILRMRWDWKRLGILITHFGIGLLFVSGLVKDLSGYEGHLSLYEGQKASHFQSYHDYEIAITEKLPDGSWKERVIPGKQFQDLIGAKSRSFTAEDLPFSLTVSHWLKNCRPTVLRSGMQLPVSDGEYALTPIDPEVKAEFNVGGALVRIRDKADDRERTELLYSLQDPVSVETWEPIRHEVGGTVYAIELRHTQFPLPYEVELEDFRRELYPGTNMPKAFESDVVVRQGDADQKVRIWMNNPLRKEGFVLFQSSWGPQGGGDGPLWSTFSVVRNPSDKWPEISCWIIAFGLCLHFGVMLARYIQREARWNA